MFRNLVSVLAAGVMLLASSALAQETRILQYGTPVEGRITNTEFELVYDFKGTEGDLVLFDLVATEDSSDLASPEMILYDRDGEPIADTLRHFGTRQARLLLPLPYSGAYTLLVTRRDGRAGDDVGDFRLRALQPPVLTPGETINDAALNNRTTNYYIIQQDTPFSVVYEYSNGEFSPTIEGYQWEEEETELVIMASLRGRGLLSGSIGMDGSTSTLHVITVGGSLYGRISANDIDRVDYRLRLVASE